MAALERTPKKVSYNIIIIRYYTGTRLIDHRLMYKFNQIQSYLFQQVHWLSVASRICRHSRQVTSTALWQPNQMRQETTAIVLFCTNSCSVQLQLGNVSATAGDCQSFCNSNEFFGFADACPARCRWASPPHQGENPQPKWRLRLISLGTVALSNTLAYPLL